MIDALFGSKTRVKLLHLFLNNPGKSFYVREMTRLIDEQINSVRRELSNMLTVGIITSDSADNKLFYEVNQRYEHYVPLREIFADAPSQRVRASKKGSDWRPLVTGLSGVRIVIAAGVLVPKSTASVDLLIVGTVVSSKVRTAIKAVERLEGRELTYSVLSYDEFYYRLSVRDKFITEILNTAHEVVVDADNILKQQK